jgi:predicted ferric reductase
MLVKRNFYRQYLPTLGGDIATFLAFLGLGITLGFAMSDATYSDLHSFEGLVILASRLTALIGTYLVLLLLMIIARVPWIERSVGFDRLVQIHSKVGPIALILIFAHFFLVVFGYALMDKKSFLSELKEILFHYEWMAGALIGIVAFLILGITSWNRFRAMLKYEIWWTLHLLSYFGIAAAFAHQLSAGSLFIFNEWARIWWIALYVYAAWTLLAWRFILPVARSLKHELRIHSVAVEGPGVVTISIQGRNLLKLKAQGGNFFEWRFLSSRIWRQAHPFSLSAPPTNELLVFTVKNLGDFSANLVNLKIGTRVVAEGPYGIFQANRTFGKRVLLIGGGVGITPIKALLSDFDDDVQIDLIYRVNSDDELIMIDEITRIAAGRKIRMHKLVGPPARFPLSPNQLVELIPDVKECEIFLCGPPGMAKAILNSLAALGIPRDRLHHEAFAFGKARRIA